MLAKQVTAARSVLEMFTQTASDGTKTLAMPTSEDAFALIEDLLPPATEAFTEDF